MTRNDDVYVVLNIGKAAEGTSQSEITAVRVPRALAGDMQFVERRSANGGRASRAVFKGQASDYNVGAVLDLDTVKAKVEAGYRAAQMPQPPQAGAKEADKPEQIFSVCAMDADQSGNMATFHFQNVGRGTREEVARRMNDPADGSFRARRDDYRPGNLITETQLREAQRPTSIAQQSMQQPAGQPSESQSQLLRRPTRSRRTW